MTTLCMDVWILTEKNVHGQNLRFQEEGRMMEGLEVRDEET